MLRLMAILSQHILQCMAILMQHILHRPILMLIALIRFVYLLCDSSIICFWFNYNNCSWMHLKGAVYWDTLMKIKKIWFQNRFLISVVWNSVIYFAWLMINLSSLLSSLLCCFPFWIFAFSSSGFPFFSVRSLVNYMMPLFNTVPS
jgi:hypothetical protein